MSLAVVVVGAAPALVQAARAEPVDCAKLLTTDVPFQTRDLDNYGKASVVQVYRGKDLRSTVLQSSDGGLRVKKFDVQGGFILRTVDSRGGEFRYMYSIPTSRFVFDQKIAEATIKHKYRGKPLSDIRTRYTYFPDSTVKISGCDIPLKHYVFEEFRLEKYVKSEIWYSPALTTALITRELSLFSGQYEVKVVALSTDFAALPDPDRPR